MGLKSNSTYWKFAGRGVLKKVEVAVCGMRCTDLRFEGIIILGMYFSYNQKKVLKCYIKYLRCSKFMENKKSYIRRKNKCI